MRVRGCLRFAFYGRVSTEDWQEPESSLARQLLQAVMLTAGRGVIAAVFFDAAESRVLPWMRRPRGAFPGVRQLDCMLADRVGGRGD
ncbi:hypothetical protein [Trebonia sp.]|uniref:hypothetical protein n=1 Tax=Trebonia sp. TaxID=2767075 RepID=UPI00261A736F|nr:hypothetical protein [Trebonia sp.]